MYPSDNPLVASLPIITVLLSMIVWMAAISWIKRHKQDAHSLYWLLALSSLLVLQSIETMYYYQRWFVEVPFFLKVADPFTALVPFCIYGYSKSLLGENVINQRYGLLHFLPVLLIALMILPFWLEPAETRIAISFQTLQADNWFYGTAPFRNGYLIIVAALCISYWGLYRYQAQTSRKRIKVWADQLQFLQLMLAGMLLSSVLIEMVSDIRVPHTTFIAAGTMYWVYQLLLNAQLPKPVKPQRQQVRLDANRESIEQITSPSNSEPNKDDLSLIHLGLLQALDNQSFCDNELSLSKLADEVGITKHQASEAINMGYGGNFYEWVNEKRITVATQLLKQSDKKITDICYEVGFNSKSTFNTAFKTITGLTPSQYRKQYQTQSPLQDLKPEGALN